MERIYYAQITSPVGPLLLAASERGLMALHFGGGVPLPQPPDQQWIEAPERLADCAAQLAAYFRGERRVFQLPLDLRGTPFQLRCWRELLLIPYGQIRTYVQLAHAVGSPRGFRAVGAANGRNPIAIIVPCHRVVASDGSLGGYGGGLEIKRRLLQLEGADPLLF